MKLNVLRADPAGNITLFVLDPIERERRAALAAELMRRLPDMKIDQVGFACPADADTDGRMEMMGGEFCGNATRAYAMYVARQRGGLSEVRLRVSGCDHIVTAAVDLARGAARAAMPARSTSVPVWPSTSAARTARGSGISARAIRARWSTSPALPTS